MTEYYIFTIFVFVLCLLLIFAVKTLILKGDKQDSSKDEKLLKLYTQVEEMMESFEEYADDVKTELEDEKKKMLRDMRIQAEDIRTENSMRKRTPEPDFSPQPTRPLRTAADLYRSSSDGISGNNAAAPRNINENINDDVNKNINENINNDINKNINENTNDDTDKNINPDAFTEVVSNDDLSKKTQIISMHKSGVPAVKIAKKMNMNISEINLIIMKQTKK